MKNVLKKKTGGEVVKRERSTVAPIVMPSRGHLGSQGQLAWEDDSFTKLNDLGNVDGNSTDVNPFRLEDGYECAAPSSFTTPHPPAVFVIAPAWMAAWQMKLSAR